MGEMVGHIFSSFTEVIGGLAGGIKTAFTTLIYEDPQAAEKVLSAPVQFSLIMGGVALAGGLVFGGWKWLRSRT